MRDTDVDVWLCALGDVADTALSAGERERAARFRFAEHRRRYVAAHVALREVLATYTATSPAEIRFRTGERGKPELVGDGPSFSLAHSGDLAAIAVAHGGPVGIDVEAVDRRPFDDGLVARISSPAERPVSSPLRLWTRKEALVKADGRGVAIRFGALSVGERGRATCELPGSGTWTVDDVEPGDGYVGAVAARRLGQVLMQDWRW